MRSNGTLASVLDMLLKPIPYLPGNSLISPRPPSRNEVKRRREKRKGKRQPAQLEGKMGETAQQFTLKGVIERGSRTPYALNGNDFSLDSDTWIFGEVRVGAEATVIGLRMSDVTYAKKIIIGG